METEDGAIFEYWADTHIAALALRRAPRRAAAQARRSARVSLAATSGQLAASDNLRVVAATAAQPAAASVILASAISAAATEETAMQPAADAIYVALPTDPAAPKVAPTGLLRLLVASVTAQAHGSQRRQGFKLMGAELELVRAHVYERVNDN